jgi:predicted ATPase/class 3 adenylate cyclase
MSELPSGTVTFLVTDLVGSTRLWEEQSDDTMSVALARHDGVLRAAIEAHGGIVFATMGDGIAAVFSSAAGALGAALDAQLQLTDDRWLRARMALHTDEGRLRAPGEYVNRPINRCARLMAIAHGGQILVSHATAVVGREALPVEASLRDLGQHHLRDLVEPIRVFQVVHPKLRSEFPPLISLDAPPGNLPRQLTSFIGRDDDIAHLLELVRDRALVTLTGVGGVGKTRLALQVAVDAAAEFPDGAWLCELAPVGDEDAIWETLAASLRIRPSPGRALADLVLEYLSSKRLLVVLDNCEHLLSAVASIVREIANRCPGVVVLATSREGIAVAGERIVAVPSLSVPAQDGDVDRLVESEAVRLFCDRASEVNDAFVLDDNDIVAVAQLCRRLDGIPLAIELAAARVRSLAPEDLVARLDQRFRILTRGSRSGLERHQTLRHTIDWSYDLLNEAEQLALNRTSVFAGGSDLRAAEVVVADGEIREVEVVDLLGSLVDKSLLDVETTSPTTRYSMLETIRQYAQERLESTGETAAVRDRHLDYYVQLVETAKPSLRGRDQLTWAARLADDVDNLRAAFDYAVDTGRPDPALRLIDGLAVTGLPIGWTAIGWAETASAVPAANNHELYPQVVAFAALDSTLSGDLDHAGVLVERAVRAQSVLGTDHLWPHAATATLALFRGDLDVTRQQATIWVARARERDDPYELTSALTQLSSALVENDLPASLAAAEEAVQVARDAGLVSALPLALFMVQNCVGGTDLAREQALREEIIAVAATLGDHQLVASMIANRETTKGRQGDFHAVLRAQADATDQYLNGGNMMMVAAHIEIAAVALAALGHYEPAAILKGFAETHIRQRGNPEYLSYLETADNSLDNNIPPTELAELKARGAALTYTQAMTYLRSQADRALGT